MSIAKKIAFNTVISVATRVFGMALALVGIGFSTRYLGPEGFGEYSTVLAFLFIFSIAADLGLQTIMVREMSKPESDEVKIVGNIFALRIAAAFAIFSAASLIIYFFPYSQNVKYGVLIVSFANFFGSLIQLLSGVFQKYLRTEKLALAEITARILQTGLIVFFVYADFGFLPIVWTIAASNLINFVIVYYFAKRLINFKIERDYAFWKKILAMSLPIGVSSMLTLVYFKFNTIILSLMKSQTEVGLFSASYKVLETSIFIPAVFAGLMMPFFSKYAFENTAKFFRYFQRSFDVVSLIALPITFGGIFFSREIMLLLGGEKFVEAAPALKLIMVATGLIFYGNLFGNVLIALGKQKTLMLVYAAGAGLSVFLNIFFISRFSYFGASFVTLLVEFFVVALMAGLFYKTVKFAPDLRIFAKAAAASLVMALAIIAFKNFGLIFAFTVSSAVYLAAIYLFGGITKDEIKLILEPTSQ